MNDCIIEFTAIFLKKDKKCDVSCFDHLLFKENVNDFFEFSNEQDQNEENKMATKTNVENEYFALNILPNETKHKYQFITGNKNYTIGKFKKDTIGFSYTIVSDKEVCGIQYEIENAGASCVFESFMEDLEKLATALRKDPDAEEYFKFLTVYNYTGYDDGDCNYDLVGVLDLDEIKIKSLEQLQKEKEDWNKSYAHLEKTFENLESLYKTNSNYSY